MEVFGWPTTYTSQAATHKTGTLGLPLFISDDAKYRDPAHAYTYLVSPYRLSSIILDPNSPLDNQALLNTTLEALAGNPSYLVVAIIEMSLIIARTIASLTRERALILAGQYGLPAVL
jgi:hypothetical protein